MNRVAKALLNVMRIEVLLALGLVMWVFSIEATAQDPSTDQSDFQTLINEERTFACNYLHSVGMKEVDGKWESVDWKTGDPFFIKWSYLSDMYVPTGEVADVLSIVADDVYYSDCKVESVFIGHCKKDYESIQFAVFGEKGVMYSLSKLLIDAKNPVHVTNFECTPMGYTDRTKQ